MNSSLLLIILLVVTACVPIPYTETTSPEIQGVLLNNGKPLKGAKLYFYEKRTKECNNIHAHEITSNQTGKFFIREKESYRLYKSVMGERIFSHHICLDFEGENYLIWEVVGFGYPSPKITIRCDLNSLKQNGKKVERNRNICIDVKKPHK